MKFPKIEWRSKMTEAEREQERSMEESLRRGLMYGDHYSLEYFNRDFPGEQGDDYRYRPCYGGTELTEYYGLDMQVVVPDTYYAGPVTSLEGTFSGKRVEYVLLPDTVRWIGSGTFSRCKFLTEIEFSKYVESVDKEAFYECPVLERIDVDPQNEEIYSIDGVLFDKFKNTLNRYPDGRKGDTYAVPEGTERIEYEAFGDCVHLKKVILPGSVKEIDEKAVNGHSSVECFEVAEDNEFFSAQGGVIFSKDRSVLILYPPGRQGENYTLPDTVKRIEKYAFRYNRVIKNLVLPESVAEGSEEAVELQRKIAELDTYFSNKISPLQCVFAAKNENDAD